MKSLLGLIMLALMMPALASAVAVDQNRLKDPALEAQARDLFKKYRCVVCDNQSIDDSNAAVAEDLRAIVREQVAAGRSEAEITDYLVARYGDFVLLNPPIKLQTALLWGLPLVLLFIGAGGLVIRRKPNDMTVSAKGDADELDSDAREKLQKWRESQRDE